MWTQIAWSFEISRLLDSPLSRHLGSRHLGSRHLGSRHLGSRHMLTLTV